MKIITPIALTIIFTIAILMLSGQATRLGISLRNYLGAYGTKFQ
jgi:hypothetical protein